MRKNSFIIALTVLNLLAIFVAGCKHAEISPATSDPAAVTPGMPVDDIAQTTGSISGIVTDENNIPVSNAIVTSGTATTTTSAYGMFFLNNISLSKNNGRVAVTKTGYFKGIRTFKALSGKWNQVKIQLMQKTLTGTVNGATGGIINLTGGTSINFPANSFSTSTGANYTGTVNVYARWINPVGANLPFIMPGDLRGVSIDGNENILQTYGMAGAELEDAGGNALKIASGKKATLNFLIPLALATGAPATIKLWHFDDATARWKEEGTAAKSGNYYLAQVDKFSFWNCDIPNINFVNIDFTLLNGNINLPLVGANCRIRQASTGSCTYGITNNTGFVSGLVPKNESLIMEIVSQCGTVVYSQSIGPFASNTSIGNIITTVSPSQVLNFTGTLVNCNMQAVSNGYISLTAGSGTGAFSLANTSGNFSFSILNCSSGTPAYTYQAGEIGNTQQSIVLSGSANVANVNLGTISICPVTTGPGVYVGGSLRANSGSTTDIAAIWKNGAATWLTDGTSIGSIKSVVVSGNDLYAAGYTFNGRAIPTIWKNGIPTPLTNGAQNAAVNSIFVDGSDVYAAGSVYHPEYGIGVDFATIWKNGQIIFADTYAEATSVYVSGTDVYWAGTQHLGSTWVAKVWKNSTGVNLTTGMGNSGEATSVFVSGSDVYVTGNENINASSLVPRLWKNGVNMSLPVTSISAVAQSVFVSGSDVYVAGSESTGLGSYRYAKLWKNGVPVNLTDGSTIAYAKSVFVSGTDVYVAGESNLNAAYWKNGLPVVLSNINHTQANSIFIR